MTNVNVPFSSSNLNNRYHGNSDLNKTRPDFVGSAAGCFPSAAAETPLRFWIQICQRKHDWTPGVKTSS